MPAQRAHLFIDYQNMHLTAHEQFGKPGSAPHSSLIHPGLLADAIDAKRAASSRPGSISNVFVFRGLPSAQWQPDFNRHNQAQAAEWTRDRRVAITHRPLRYPTTWQTRCNRSEVIQ